MSYDAEHYGPVPELPEPREAGHIRNLARALGGVAANTVAQAREFIAHQSQEIHDFERRSKRHQPSE